MTHGSLFSGIGGFDLAAHWMCWDNIFHCEWNEFGQKVLKHHFPTSKSYNDITKTDFTIHRGSIDILTGGFPCQPYSTAGKRLGKADERHLFPEMLRAIKEIKPRWQKKRLEIMQRDGFQCTCCGDTETEIHVHHSYYEFGKEVWEYPEESLFTLCSSCHYQHTLSQKRIKELMRTIQYDQLYEFEKIVNKCALMNPYELDLVNKFCLKIIEDNGTSL